ncbi:MAG: hypothetical protein RMM08_09860 [Armatimonadota bacterium]|nr:hypothetical protein [Armatimonadota bacterium]
MKHLLLAITCVVSVACWLPAQAQTPLEWLERMERAERTVALDGVRLTQFFLPAPLPPVEERVLRLGTRYRIEYLQPPARRGEVLIDDGLHRFHYVPRLKRVQSLPSDQPLILRRRRELLQRLRRGEILLEAREAESVAGRRAVLLEAKNRQGQPLRRWWIDRDHGVILRMEELTPRGEVRMRTEYIRLTVPAVVPPERFTPRFPAQARQMDMLPPSRAFASVEEAQLLVPFTIREPQPLPKGFQLVEVRLRLVRQRPLVSLHYTDEVTSIALFQTRLPLRADAPLLKALTPLGARVEAWRDGDVNLILVGNAPLEVFEQMRKAVKQGRTP